MRLGACFQPIVITLFKKSWSSYRSKSSRLFNFSREFLKELYFIKRSSNAPTDESERTPCQFCDKAFAERHHFINHANKVWRFQAAFKPNNLHCYFSPCLLNFFTKSLLSIFLLFFSSPSASLGLYAFAPFDVRNFYFIFSVRLFVSSLKLFLWLNFTKRNIFCKISNPSITSSDPFSAIKFQIPN